jgi:hypothetical protein
MAINHNVNWGLNTGTKGAGRGRVGKAWDTKTKTIKEELNFPGH